MKKIIHRANDRGFFNHGWLETHHTFSFANFFDPERIRFGMLRVLNDDTVEGGEGFGTHPHDNMEIVSIPLEGILEHADSMGNARQLRPGMIQVMSAGTGITHSEYNGSRTEPVKFLQVWILTDRRGHIPRYDDITYGPLAKNGLTPIVAPKEEAGPNVGWLNQLAWLYLAEIDKGRKVGHRMHGSDKGTYIFVIEGEAEVEGEKLGPRDGMGVWDSESVTVKAETPAKILLIEVPMK